MNRSIKRLLVMALATCLCGTALEASAKSRSHTIKLVSIADFNPFSVKKRQTSVRPKPIVLKSLVTATAAPKPVVVPVAPVVTPKPAVTPPVVVNPVPPIGVAPPIVTPPVILPALPPQPVVITPVTTAPDPVFTPPAATGLTPLASLGSTTPPPASDGFQVITPIGDSSSDLVQIGDLPPERSDFQQIGGLIGGRGGWQ